MQIPSFQTVKWYLCGGPGRCGYYCQAQEPFDIKNQLQNSLCAPLPETDLLLTVDLPWAALAVLGRESSNLPQDDSYTLSETGIPGAPEDISWSQVPRRQYILVNWTRASSTIRTAVRLITEVKMQVKALFYSWFFLASVRNTLKNRDENLFTWSNSIQATDITDGC